MDFKFENGTKVKDQITGFTGVITGRADYITGCNTYLLTPGSDPKSELTEYPKTHWIDEARLKVISDKVVEVDQAEKPGGGPNPPSK